MIPKKAMGWIVGAIIAIILIAGFIDGLFA